ncbi:hypothetical protein AbraIFM66950_001429 [Aspergillus brasiliensis]|nr:hypothetical protein AbraIFM66950_001429 [Aspergillus brasiliensis]
MLHLPRHFNHPRGAKLVRESLAPPKGHVLVKIESSKVKPSPKSPCISSCNYLASYTQLDRGDSSILIPGRPPLWTPPRKVLKLQDAPSPPKLRVPKAPKEQPYPWEASFEAIRRQNPRYNFQRTDIVTCAAILRSLFDFIRGISADIRFIMERMGKTVVFIRREVPPPILLPEAHNFDADFVKKHTRWEDEAAKCKSNQRIIQYNFGGINMIVRSESDAYIRDQKMDSEGGTESTKHKANIDSPTEGIGGLWVYEGGEPVAQNQILETNVRSMYNDVGNLRRIDMTTIFPRLWASQIPNLAVGYHKKGVMKSLRVSDMKEELLKWERDNEEHLSRLAHLLNDLTGHARASPARLEVCRDGHGSLEICQLAPRDAPKAVSPEMKLYFDSLRKSGSGSATGARQ